MRGGNISSRLLDAQHESIAGASRRVTLPADVFRMSQIAVDVRGQDDRDLPLSVESLAYCRSARARQIDRMFRKGGPIL